MEDFDMTMLTLSKLFAGLEMKMADLEFCHGHPGKLACKDGAAPSITVCSLNF